MNEEFREFKYKTKFGQIIKGTNYGNYAVDNEFLKDNNNFIEKKSQGAKFQFSILYKGYVYGFWTDYKEGLCYLSTDYDPSSKLQYAITDSEHKPNLMLVKNLSRSHLLKGAMRAYEEGYLRFESLIIKNQFIEILGVLRG